MTELPSKELLQRQKRKSLEASRRHWENRSMDLPLKIVLPNKKRIVPLQREITKKFVTKKYVVWKTLSNLATLLSSNWDLIFPIKQLHEGVIG